LFFDRIQCFPQGFSADGKQLAFVTITPETDHDIWVVDMSGAPGANGPPRRAWLASRFRESYARISPNGQWLAYTSNESGAFNVYGAPLAQPALKRPVSTDHGRLPIWSRDGKELYYLREGVLIAVPISSAGGSLQLGKAITLFDTGVTSAELGVVTPYDVAPDGRFMINRFVERTAPSATVIVNWSASTPH
jgi:hypothetical protein